MAKVMHTPGVYIVEKNAFPNSVVEVATAVPAFVGYTQTAATSEKPLLNVPRRITSMAEYHNYFGFGPPLSFALAESTPVAGATAGQTGATDPIVRQTMVDAANAETKYDYTLDSKTILYKLYHSMLLFFQNGGGPCFVVSVGDYSETPTEKALKKGIDTLIKEQEPTMVVIPDATLLGDATICANVHKHSLMHCRDQQSRFSIIDIYGGQRARDEGEDCVTEFRNVIGVNDLDYGAAYYPWLETTIVSDSDLSYHNIDSGSLTVLQTMIKRELDLENVAAPAPPNDGEEVQPPNAELKKKLENLALVEKLTGNKWSADEQKELKTNEALLHKSLFALSPNYKAVLKGIKTTVNSLPPSAAMAGIYTMVDNTRGVWKAPANVSLNGVIRPSVNISHDEQQDLNVNTTGKSINAIRSFIGEGTLVWGGRTLDGNSLDWRYINVRRTLIMLEQSMKYAAKAYVFEANDANTWTTMKSMSRNFLTGIWKRGGLAGASPDDAFSVFVGLGETMTPEDILEGILRITILVAPTRPAEFIEITFQQQMQKS